MRLAKPVTEMKPHYDVVIVGSGYGGGVSASRLARAGKSVCVIERGKEWPTGSFPARFPEMRHEIQVRGGAIPVGPATALFEFRKGEDVHVLVGCGLGGGSLVNAGVALRPDERVFGDPSWPKDLHDGLMDEGYKRAEHMLAPAAYKDSENLPKYQALDAAGAKVEGQIEKARTNVSFKARINAAGVQQEACTLCGDCCSGCNVGAKNTVAMTYLPDAVAHGAEMFTELKVVNIAKNDEKWTVRFAPTLDADADIVENQREVMADIVILAAGTLGSTEILLRAKASGLALSDQLGAGFTGNGDIIAFGFDADRRVHAVGLGHPQKFETDPVGPCVAGQIKVSNAAELDKEMYIQEGVLPSALGPLLPAIFVPGGRIMGALSALIKGVYGGPLSKTQTYFVVSHDDGEGVMKLTPKDRLAIFWPDVNEQPVFARVDAALKGVSEAIGGTYVKNPLDEGVMGQHPATAHPLGGCGLGENRTTGVVNHKCQVFDASGGEEDAVHRGLYVCDGSVIPRSLGVNPLMTITAITERAMIHLARDLNIAFDTTAVDEMA